MYKHVLFCITHFSMHVWYVKYMIYMVTMYMVRANKHYFLELMRERADRGSSSLLAFDSSSRCLFSLVTLPLSQKAIMAT